MKKIVVLIPALLLVLAPSFASAHEHGIYSIGNSQYQITIGSLNEPISVGDKTGVDLAVSKCATSACAPTMGDDGDLDGPVGPGVAGLGDTLKVDISAGGKTQTFSLTPAGEDGSYEAVFYPTAATTYSYRVFGTIEGAPVDLTFSCIPDASAAQDVTTAKDLGGGVTQKSLSGGFTCPVSRDALEFPAGGASGSSMPLTWAALALSVVAFGTALYRKKQ